MLFGLNQERAFVGESCCKWFSLLVLPPLIFEGVWYLYVGPLFVKWLEALMHDDARALSFEWADVLPMMAPAERVPTAAMSTCTLYDVWARKSLGAVPATGTYTTPEQVASRDSVFLTMSDCH